MNTHIHMSWEIRFFLLETVSDLWVLYYIKAVFGRRSKTIQNSN